MSASRSHKPDASWIDGPAVAFDLETTAPEPELARIVSASVVTFNGKRETDRSNLLADPGVEIPPEATRKHGITTEFARANGQPVESVIIELLGMLGNRGDYCPVIAMNARYDLTVLDREARRHGLADQIPVGYPGLVLDPLVIDRHIDRYRKGRRDLPALCAHYGVAISTHHVAEDDALSAAALTRAICAVGRFVPGRVDDGAGRAEWSAIRTDAVALQVAQCRWHTAWCRHFAEWQRDQGKMALANQIAAERWPLQPLAT